MRSAALGAPDVGWAVTAALLVAIGGVPPLASAVLGVVLLGQAAIGERVMRRARWWGEAGWQERLLLRVVVGAALATAVDQLARVALGPGALASSAWWLAALVAIVVPERVRGRRGEAPAGASGDSASWREWIWLAVIACLLLAHEVLWTVETAVALALIGVAAAGAVGARRIPMVLRAGLVAAGVAVAWWGIDRRPAIRLLPDDRFFARVVWSLGEWGFTTNPSTFGEPFRYHWLSYAWLGLLGRASGASPADAVQTVGPIVVAVLCAVGLVTLALGLARRPGTAIPAAALAAACSTYAITLRGRGFHIGWVESFSQFASIPVALALMALAHRAWTRPGLGSSALTAVALYLTAGVKVSTAAVAVGVLAIGIAIRWWHLRRDAIRHVALGASGVVGAALGALAFSDPGVDETSRSGLVRPYWPVTSLGDLWRWYDDSLAKWGVVMALMLIGLAGAIPFAALVARRPDGHGMRTVASVTIAAGGLTALALTGLITSTEPWYGLHVVTAVAWLRLATSIVEDSRAPWAAPAIALGAIVGMVTRWGDIERSDPDQILWIYVTRPALPAIAALVALAVLVARAGTRRHAAVAAGTLLVVASVVLAGTQWWRQQRADFRDWEARSTAQPSTDDRDLSRWLDDRTDSRSVLASLSDVVTIATRRREAVALPTYGYPFPPYRSERIEALRRMYAVPDCAETQRQVARGVTHAVTTVEEAAVGALDACATRVYENPSYVVYELAKAP